MPTDTSELGLEELICQALAGDPCKPPTAATAGEPPESRGGAGWSPGNHHDYDREFCVDLVQLRAFLHSTQPAVAEALALEGESPTRRRFLARLQGEINKRGTIDVLRNGLKHGPSQLTLFYGTPSPGNEAAAAQFAQNRFTVTRQLRYSRRETGRALDLGLFINGLPVLTFELKNNLTKQTVHDAIQQYKNDRNPREPLFAFGRCVAHFAVDESEVRFCTELKGKASWFLPFNRGLDDGAGNPQNPDGLKTDYLWRKVLTRGSLTNILENYAQVLETQEEGSSRKRKSQIWPRYHQLDVVRRLLADIREQGAGQRYLIQHSAGSGKSNSIAWLAHQLIGLQRDGSDVFDSIIVVTDRVVLDRQIRGTIKQFAQVAATIGAARSSGDLLRFIEQGKKIIISTVQKFPFILDEIGNEQRHRSFAIIIDEAHSSQGGKTAGAMAEALGEAGEVGEEETYEDRINRMIESRKLLTNASYFAFTATPKNKTLEIFGQPVPQPGGGAKHKPFHSYTMKQAIQEGFILDVLQNYTPVQSYYRLAKVVEDDPEFDPGKAQRKLRRYVEQHEGAVREKAEIMVDHFHRQIASRRLMGGQARAMVVTSGIQQALSYYHAIKSYLRERNSPYQALVAFSGEHQYGAVGRVTEASLNGFPAGQTAAEFQKEPYRFLVVADKFQTGYDEPLLHTMYVDKPLGGIQAVQTLSRLNRAHPKKRDTFVLDFCNGTEIIQEAFAPYYRTTILSGETDPNKLHNFKADLDGHQVYTPDQVEAVVQQYLEEAERDALDPILDLCVAEYLELDEDSQVDFKGKAKAFVRTYGFLATILSFNIPDWEKLCTFLSLLLPKLPAPVEEDLSQGILEAIDMDSYRAEVQTTLSLTPEEDDEETEIHPSDESGGHGVSEPQMTLLSQILEEFNNQFGNIAWSDEDRIRRIITEEIPAGVAAVTAYQNAMRNNDAETARVQMNEALRDVMLDMLQDQTDLFREYTDNEPFRRWLANAIFRMTYQQGSPPAPEAG